MTNSKPDENGNWEKWYDKDPLPKVDPSLLNSDHIHQYAHDYGCLISHYREEHLKPASYEIQLYGELHYWQDIYADPSSNARPEKEKGKDLQETGR